MKIVYCIWVIIVFVMTGCNHSNMDNTDKKTSIIDNVQINVQNIQSKPFPNEEYIQSIDSSILELCVHISDGKKSKSWAGQCSLYCNKDNMSYLILPNHCFPYDSTKSYSLWATDFKKRSMRLFWTKLMKASPADAQVLVVEKIKGLPTLCERGKIAKETIVGDSAVLVTPFNVRNVHRKFEILNKNNEMKMFTMFGEPGDSGGLILGRNGIIGVEVSGSNYGEQIHFVPIRIFEELYGDIVCNQKKPS